MSVWQWFLKKISLLREKNVIPTTNEVPGSSVITEELSLSVLKKNGRLLLISIIAALFIAPIIYFFPQIQRWVRATVWQTPTAFDSTGNVGLYGSSMLNGSSLFATTYYDKTNKTIKYAERSLGGSWTIENIETFGADYATGINSDKNAKFGIALSPVDSKMSVAYCNYAMGGLANQSSLRFAHRVGGGLGNCGTSNNWSCETASGFYNTSCSMRMISLGYAPTSSIPTMAYLDGNSLKINENIPGPGWTETTIISGGTGLIFDQNQTVLKFLSNGAPIIFFVQNDGAANNYVKYTYRSATTWTWSAPATIFTEAWNGASVEPYAISVVADPNVTDLFHITAGLNNNLHYTTLNSSFVVGSDTAVDAGTFTWNSVIVKNDTYPAISYYDYSADALKYASFNGSIWTAESVVAAMGSYVSMVEDTTYHYPYMSFYDLVNGNATFVTQNTAPSAPTTLYTSSSTAQIGSVNPTQLATTTPAFSAIFQDIDSGDTSNKAQIQLTTATDGFATVNIWDSGATTFTPTISVGGRSPNLKYNEFGNPPLFAGLLSLGDDGFVTNPDTVYYWRIRFWDQNNVAGEWSATNTFTLLDRPAAPASFTVRVPFPYTTSANTATTTVNGSYPNSAESVVVTLSTDGATYTTIATSTVVSGATSNAITLPTDVFSLSTHYYLRAHYYNILGVSADTSDVVLDTFVEPTITIDSVSCNSLAVHAVDPHFSGSSSFLFQYYDGTSNTYFSTYPTSEQTLSNLTSGAVYNLTVYLTAMDARISNYGSSNITGRLPACNAENLSVVQTAVDSAQVRWGNDVADSGVYYVVRNTINGEQVTVTQGSPHAHTFTGLEATRTYTFSIQAYNADNIPSSAATTVNFTMGGASFAVPDIYDMPATGMFKVYQPGMPDGYVTSTDVLLDITSAGAGWMQISNKPDFTNAQWYTLPSPLVKGFPWKLEPLITRDKTTREVRMKLLNKSGLKELVLPVQTVVVDPLGINPPQVMYPRAYDSVGTKILFSGTAQPGMTIKIKSLDGEGNTQLLGETTASTESTGAWLVNLSTRLTEGSHTILVTAADARGNESVPVQIPIFVNLAVAALPQTPSVQYPIMNGPSITTQPITTYGVAEPFTHIIIKNFSGSLQDIDTLMTDADANGQWRVTLPLTIADGFHTYSYYAKNDAGQTSNPYMVSFRVGAELPETVVPQKDPEPIKKEDIVPIPKEPVRPPVEPLVPVKVDTPKGPDTPKGADTAFDKTDSNPVATPTVSSGLGGPTTQIVNIIEVPTQVISDLKDSANNLLDSAVSIFNPGTQDATPTEVAQKVVTQTKETAIQTIKTVKKTAEVARVIADTPEVQTANKAVVVPTAAAVGVASVTTAANIPEMLLYLRFLFTQPFALINRRRRKQWGMVYNAITKMPIDLAVVRLIDVKQNRIAQSRVTDRAGRYHFFAEPGTYRIEVTRADFTFPPAYLKGKTVDGNIADLYLGAEIVLEKAGAISVNIPLDPIGVQKTTKQILKEAAKKNLAALLSVAGVLVTAVSFVITPTPLVGGFLAVHVGSYLLFRRISLGKHPKGWGFISDAFSKNPVERAVVRIFDTQYSKLLETQVTDNKGRYGFLVGKNEYYVMAEHIGHKKFVSNPIKIENEQEGGIVGVDIKLEKDAGTAITVGDAGFAGSKPEVKTEIADGSTLYVPKTQIPGASENKSGLLREVSEKKPELKIEISPENSSDDLVATFTRVNEISKPIVGTTKADLPQNSTSKLLAPISGSSKNLVITGIEKNIDELPSIVSDGNFLDAIDKKIWQNRKILR